MASTTTPMTRNELDAWLRLHCDDLTDVTALLDTYTGHTEDEMEAELDAQHGSMA